MNGQNNNSSEKVKSKFFNQDLFDGANVSDVGSSTSGQVISWGVGGNRKSNPELKDVSVLDSTQMFNFVNTEITDFQENNSYNDGIVNQGNEILSLEGESFDDTQFSQSISGQDLINTSTQQIDYANNIEEVLAESRVDSSVNSNGVANEFVQSNPVFTGYNADSTIIAQNNNMANSNLVVSDNGNPEVVSTFDPFNGNAESAPVHVQQSSTAMSTDYASSQLQQSSPLFAMAVESQNSSESYNKDFSPLNITSADGMINDDMRGNQPLSLTALSGETIDESQKAKEVVEESKYFQSTPLEDNKLKAEDVVPIAAPAVDVLAEPIRDINLKELEMTFAGSEYSKISMSPFSFYGAFFGNLYFFYRKMFIEGVILTVVNFFITFVLYKSYVVGFGLALGEFIVLGLLTNPIYLSFTKRQARSIANRNPKATQFDLQKICQLKGGTNLFLGLLIAIILNSLSMLILNNVAGTPSFMEFLNGSKIVLHADDKAVIEDVVDYQLPADFERVKTGQVPFVVKETVKKRGKELHIESCGFNIYLVSGHDTSKDLVTYMADTDQRYNRVSTYKTIAGEVWDTYEYDGDEYFYYYRARNFDGHIVLVTYVKHIYATEGMCEIHLENIMNSIKEKKKE